MQRPVAERARGGRDDGAARAEDERDADEVGVGEVGVAEGGVGEGGDVRARLGGGARVRRADEDLADLRAHAVVAGARPRGVARGQDGGAEVARDLGDALGLERAPREGRVRADGGEPRPVGRARDVRGRGKGGGGCRLRVGGRGRGARAAPATSARARPGAALDAERAPVDDDDVRVEDVHRRARGEVRAPPSSDDTRRQTPPKLLESRRRVVIVARRGTTTTTFVATKRRRPRRRGLARHSRGHGHPRRRVVRDVASRGVAGAGPRLRRFVRVGALAPRVPASAPARGASPRDAVLGASRPGVSPLAPPPLGGGVRSRVSRRGGAAPPRLPPARAALVRHLAPLALARGPRVVRRLRISRVRRARLRRRSS